MDEYAEYRDAWQPDNQTAIRYGCIRITDGTHDTTDPSFITNPGLYIHNNSGHTSVGVEQVRIDKATGYIRVDTPGSLNGVPLVTGDETAAAQGLLFGGSGGNGYVNILCYKIGNGTMDLRVQATYDLVASSGLNLWLAWLSPLVRGVGDPSASERIADLEARVLALEGA